MLLNPSQIIIVGCYIDAYFVGLLGHESSQDCVCAKIKT